MFAGGWFLLSIMGPQCPHLSLLLLKTRASVRQPPVFSGLLPPLSHQPHQDSPLQSQEVAPQNIGNGPVLLIVLAIYVKVAQ